MAKGKNTAEYMPEFEPGTLDPLSSQERAQAIEAFNLIQPAPEERKQCADEIATRIKCLGYSKCFETVSPPSSPATTKETLLATAKKLRLAASVFDKNLRNITFLGQVGKEDLNKSLDISIAAAKRMAAEYEQGAAEIRVPKGGSLRSEQKKLAVEYAWILLRNYGARPPGLTKGGRWHQLAKILHEDDVSFEILRWYHCEWKKFESDAHRKK
jgi:hypothetical protein